LKRNLLAHTALSDEISRGLLEAREAWMEISTIPHIHPPSLPVAEIVSIRHGEAEREAWEDWPPYCCVILTGQGSNAGKIFVEERGGEASVAAGKLTCFGGKREQGELPSECITREAQEELAWLPRGPMLRVCDFYVDNELIAWFYEAQGPSQGDELSFEPGRAGVWVDPCDERMSPWHASVLQARQLNKKRADFWKEKREKQAPEAISLEYSINSPSAGRREESACCVSDVTEIQLSGAKLCFRSMDLDENGMLSHKEIKRYLRSSPEASHILKPPHTSWQGLYAKMEADSRDHRIDEEGFVNYYIEMCTLMH